MGCATQSMMLSANSSTSLLFFNTRGGNHKHPSSWKKQTLISPMKIRASAEDSDCNVEECAPDKEVGKVSMEWLAGDKTKVVGTYPPRKRGWTGYIEKDTAGQTNIYSVEPAVYVAESGISSGTAGSSSDGSENTVAIAAGIALISVAAASLILLQVGKNSPQMMQTEQYSGPSLSYYINKFKLQETIEASVPAEAQTAVPVESERNPSEAVKVEAESGYVLDASTSNPPVS
ncbi:hypothetical protein NMG60_11029635 [Bertholletia excelsa]